eukprot:172447_1
MSPKPMQILVTFMEFRTKLTQREMNLLYDHYIIIPVVSHLQKRCISSLWLHSQTPHRTVKQIERWMQMEEGNVVMEENNAVMGEGTVAMRKNRE